MGEPRTAPCPIDDAGWCAVHRSYLRLHCLPVERTTSGPSGSAPSTLLRDYLCAIGAVALVIVGPTWLAAVTVAVEGAYMLACSRLAFWQAQLLADMGVTDGT